MDIFWTAVIVFTFVTSFASAFRRGADDAAWELRWRSLDAEGRARTVAAAHSRDALAQLTAPEDRVLVGGYARHRRRQEAYVDLGATSILIVAAAFALAGLLGTGWLGLLTSLFLVASALWKYLSEKQMGGKLRAVAEAESTAAH